MLSKNKFAVVCPTYNSADFVRATIESVLNQELLPEELILIDDGSRDSTVKVLERIRSEYKGAVEIKILHCLHNGPGASRNQGVIAAKSEWIAFLDSDDLWYTDKLLEVDKAINRNSDINILCHSENYVPLNGEKRVLNYGKYIVKHVGFKTSLFRVNPFSTSATICKKELLLQHGMFDENLMSSQDYELWLRLAPSMNPYFIENVLGEYYERQGNISTTKSLLRLKNMLIIYFRYRKYDSILRFAYQTFYIIAYFLYRFFKSTKH
jgi:glycosyltransferase involved in cell wall biosynthesis